MPRLPLLHAALLTAGLALSLVSCSQGGNNNAVDATTQCSDGLDNDLDTFVDLADPDCTDAGDNDEFASGVAVCMDGLDNDSDGKIDYPDDPGCLAANQNSGEGDDCPSGDGCPQCGNGVDDDGDGETDFAGGDTGCDAASDDDEYTFDPEACGVGTSVSNLPMTGVISGVLAAGPSNVTAACGAGTVGTGPEVAYVVTVVRPVRMVASTDFPGTNFDSVLYLRRACSDAATQLACSDDVVGGTRSTLSLDVQPGTYFLIVDAKTPAALGAYTLVVNQYAGAGETCTNPDQCAPGFVCRSVGGAADTCERPVCDDGRDDDGDTLIDYPLDPGCTTPDDSTETDTCPGAGCPECGNGLDDDTDGQTDYPDDVSCTSASGTAEADCPIETDAILEVTSAASSGTTVGATSQFEPTCGFPSTNIGDRVHMLYLRAPLATLTIDTNDSPFDTVVSLYDSLCATELACDDDGGEPGLQSRITRTGVAAGAYAIVIDGYGTGAYNLRVAGTYAAGAACDPTMPMFTCSAGYGCTGPAGSAICAPAACNDTVDADGDGLPGFPTDPGCTSTADVDETDDCPLGPNCPQCANDADDDGDTLVDYPDDLACLSASGTNEDCSTTDPVRLMTTSTLTNQSTTTLANDFDLACGTDGRDEVFRVIVDHPLDELRVDTIGSVLDTVVGIRRATCTGFDLQCDDNGASNGDSLAFLVDPQLGEYFVVVDDRNVASPGTYNLRVQGRYLDGGRCNPSSIFTCSAGRACAGTAGAETCVPAACNDTVDADGDGFPGYPTDPGCASTSDGDETDACPSGPGCPECSNGLDDDGDGAADYGTDLDCVAASGSEDACQIEAAPLLQVDAVITAGTTVGATSEFEPTCASGSTINQGDRVHMLTVRRPLATLTIDTNNSTLNTVLSLYDSTCTGAPTACDDDGGDPGTQSRITRTNVAVGSYALVVDGYNSSNTYLLNVRGTYADGAVCDPTAAMFACSPGFACAGAAGAETCMPAACNDTVDQDGDGFPGYPADPGCASTSDDTETDNCPSGPGCPACSNDLDDDGDGAIDYGMDLDCIAASSTSEASCQIETEPLLPITAVTTTGTTTGATSQFEPTCNTFATPNLADRVHMLYVTSPLATLSLDTNNSPFDTVLSLYPSTCTGAPLDCDDDDGEPDSESLITRTNVPPGAYAVVVDAYSGGGAYNLNVRGTYALGAACDPTSPMFTCSAGEACTGPAGSAVCAPAACNDTVDADGDGFPGFPSDPGCTSINDGDETDTCPSGPGCPVCSNDLDDDSDGRIDYLLDPACESAAGTTERECFPEADPLITIVAPATMGTTTGATNSFEPSCQTTDNNDRAMILELPVPVATLTMNTHNSTMSDTIMLFMNASCGAELECDDDDGDGNWSSIVRTMVPAGTYAIVVDGYSSNVGPFTLNVTGTVAAGNACTSPLFAAGVLACLGTCTAGVCQ